jgi:nicotinamidase-related amidase
MTRTLELDPRTTAIVNVHWQREVVTRDGAIGSMLANEVERRDVVKHAAQALTAAREHGALVVFARVAFRPGYPELIRNCALFEQVVAQQLFQEGTPGTEIIPELAPEAGEPIVTHGTLSAFHGTDLDLILRARGATHVLLTGVSTNGTVEGTARDAAGLGYRTVLVADACAAADATAHDATLATFQLLGTTLNSTELAAAFGGEQSMEK